MPHISLSCILFMLGFLQDQDLVPSDVAAGLSLLHRKQDKIDISRDPEVIVDPSHSPPNVSKGECGYVDPVKYIPEQEFN